MKKTTTLEMHAERKIRAHCAVCGKALYSETECTFVSIPRQKNGVRVCKDCTKVHSYHGFEKPIEWQGKATKGEFQISPEWEFLYKREDDTSEKREAVRAKLAAFGGMAFEHDGSLGCNGAEGSAPRFASMHGFIGTCKYYESLVNLDNSSCGHHINFSKYGWTYHDGVKLANYRHELFSSLQEYLARNSESTVKHMGRYFKNYCDECMNQDHYSWLTVRKDYENDSSCIELRLAHFKDAKQYTHLAFLCKEFAEVLQEWLDEKISTNKASRELVNLYKKHESGKANYQRPERNK